MTLGERNEYFGRLWPAACEVCDWNPKDENKRRAIALQCMREVRGPLVTTSSPDFGRDEVTALFTYLIHLADPASLDKSARWDTCKQDYRTFNRARQADYHENNLYGRRKNKFDRNRFRGETSAGRGPLDSLDAEEVRKRHMTFASRIQKKKRVDRKVMRMIEKPEDLARVARGKRDILENAPAPRVIVLPPPAAPARPRTVAHVKADVPF